ncbi:MAG: hypothetical protein ABI604_17120 [Nitrospirota bacterium]
MPPWVYRKARRSQALDLSDLALVEVQNEGGAVSCGPSRETALSRQHEHMLNQINQVASHQTRTD